MPFVAVFMAFLVVGALCSKRYRLALCILFALITINILFEIIPIHFLPLHDSQRDKSTLKIMSFNVDGSRMGNADAKADSLAKFIHAHEPDVVFLIEDFDTIGGVLDSLLKNEYPYSTYKAVKYYTGHYFYSKYPLGIFEQIPIESTRFNYDFHCNIFYQGDSISLYGLHLASNNYSESNAYMRPEDVNGLSKLWSYLNNIKHASTIRSEEVIAIKARLAQDTYPTIVMGDMNDVSGSKPLNILEDAGFKDAWWEGGFGYGATHPLPFRIDHIMYNDELELVDIKKVDSKGLSDHDALVATFKLIEK